MTRAYETCPQGSVTCGTPTFMDYCTLFFQIAGFDIISSALDYYSFSFYSFLGCRFTFEIKLSRPVKPFKASFYVYKDVVNNFVGSVWFIIHSSGSKIQLKMLQGYKSNSLDGNASGRHACALFLLMSNSLL